MITFTIPEQTFTLDEGGFARIKFVLPDNKITMPTETVETPAVEVPVEPTAPDAVAEQPSVTEPTE